MTICEAELHDPGMPASKQPTAVAWVRGQWMIAGCCSGRAYRERAVVRATVPSPHPMLPDWDLLLPYQQGVAQAISKVREPKAHSRLERPIHTWSRLLGCVVPRSVN